MQPKTKLQKQVVEMSKTLKPITEKQKVWAYEHGFDNYAYRTKKEAVCFTCSHRWEHHESGKTTCPSCGKKLIENKYPKKRIINEAFYYGIIDTKNGFQVIRLFYVERDCKVGEKAFFKTTEVIQHWIRPDGKYTTMAKLRIPMRRDVWGGGELEIRARTESWAYYGDPNNINPFKIYPIMKSIPEVKRNGFKSTFYDISPRDLFVQILTDSKCETMLKTGQISMLASYERVKQRFDKYWPSVKICIRNGYKITDAQLWMDYIDLLSYFGKDLRSPRYVCFNQYGPMKEHLIIEHNRLSKRKTEIEEAEAQRQKRNRAEEFQKEYEQAKAHLLGLCFSDGPILVKTLDTVQEFVEEAEALNHCVFSNEYFKKVESLILSARIDEKPIETIEIDLRDLHVIQCRGANNKATEHHDEILQIVEKNKHQILARLKQTA